MHWKECVDVAYFHFPVNRKHDKLYEFFHSYLHYGASYAPEKKDNSGCRVQKFSVLTQKPFFGMHLEECVAIAYFQFPASRKHDKRCEIFHSYLLYGASYAPEAGGVERRVLLDAGYENSALKHKDSFFGMHLKTGTELRTQL
jgi:hypothetical protein